MTTKSKLLILGLLSCLSFFHALPTFASGQCRQLFAEVVPKPPKEDPFAGPRFLYKTYPNLAKSAFVEHRTQQVNKNNLKPLIEPQKKIAAWLGYLEHSYQQRRSNPTVIARIKEYYFANAVIQPHKISKSYFDLQVEIAQEKGKDILELTEKVKQDLAKVVIDDQRKSFEKWLDYFFSSDSENYPMWAKYWSFTSLKKLSTFDPESGTFKDRSPGQAAPYPELNREALEIVMDSMVNSVNNKSLENFKDAAFLNYLKVANFGKLYGRALQILNSEKWDPSTTSGLWVKYKQGTDSAPLFKSLQGIGISWCTAQGELTAETQLKIGGFYIYYSHDKFGKAKIPRLAIHMDGPKIDEIRGIGPEQNIDADMVNTSVLKEKLLEFGKEADQYQKRFLDMEKLTEIKKNHKNGLDLSKEELRFLYEIDGKIAGFGQHEDTRIKEILYNRDPRKDILLAFDGKLKAHEISLTNKEALRGGIKFHYGDLNFDHLTSGEGVVLPEIVSGSVSLSKMVSIKGLVHPKSIGGDYNLKEVVSAYDGAIMPRKIGGAFKLDKLVSAKSIIMPDFVGEDLNLYALISTKGLSMPRTVGGDVSLLSLKSAEDGLDMSYMTIGGSVFLSALELPQGLQLPSRIGNHLYLRFLKAAQGLRFPDWVGGDVMLDNLETKEGLDLSDMSVGGEITVSSAAGIN
ncbi:MAG: hypothetical protein WA160_12140 [Pseudobdellovibrio sp.]